MHCILTPETVEESTRGDKVDDIRQLSPPSMRDYGPFASESAFCLAEWYWASPSKSFRDFQSLAGILRNPQFSLNDVNSVNWKRAFKELGSNPGDLPDREGNWIQDEGWRCMDVVIEVPFHSRMQTPGTDQYTAGQFRYRPILSVIKERLTDASKHSLFQYSPYKMSWRRNADSPEVELYGEIYTSRIFRQVHDDLQRQPFTDQNKGLERVVVALMFSSDATHLTSFGNASLWPCYLFFGNESKYDRCKPSARLGEQVAYFLKVSHPNPRGVFAQRRLLQLPDNFKDYLRERNGGKLPYADLAKYCSRLLFHQQWSILLDRDLLDAMKDGIVLLCPDGKRRCFYPRIFTYSADYPEQ